MVKSPDSSKSDDASASRRLDLASGRRIARERHVRTVLVVEAHVFANASEQVPLAEHDRDDR